MTQSFMYKRVNIFLLLLMCLIVVGLAGSAIYFQESFKSLNSNYESVLGNFTTCTQVLDTKESKLNSCISDLNSTAKDVGVYDQLYEKKVDDLKGVQDELLLTDRELKNTKLELIKANDKYQQELKRSLDLEKQIGLLNQEIVGLKALYDQCKDDLAAC